MTMIRKMICLLAAALLLTAAGAAAEGTRPVQLPGSRYAFFRFRNSVGSALRNR